MGCREGRRKTTSSTNVARVNRDLEKGGDDDRYIGGASDYERCVARKRM